MANRLKQIFLSCKAAINSLKNDDGSDLFKCVNTWDDQIDITLKEKNEGYSFNMPACFVEVDLGDEKQMGNGMTQYPDAIIRIHFCNDILNSGDDMEENLEIFDIRDSVKKKFNRYGYINFCSTLQCVKDKLDYKHKAVYKYILEFKTNFIDNSGSVFEDETPYKLLDPTLLINVYYNIGDLNFFCLEKDLVNYFCLEGDSNSNKILINE